MPLITPTNFATTVYWTEETESESLAPYTVKMPRCQRFTAFELTEAFAFAQELHSHKATGEKISFISFATELEVVDE